MRFSFEKKALFVFAFAASILLFCSCQQVVFDNIRKEVQLEDGRIAGDIRAIVRFKDNFFLANGGIYYKNKDLNFYGCWGKAPSPKGHVIRLAADSTYLYALVGVSEENTKEGTNEGVRRELWYSADGNSWALVSGFENGGALAYSSKYVVYIYLMCTNAIDASNRSAYVVVNDGIKGLTNKAYRLNGSEAIQMELGSSDASTKPFSNSVIASRSCVYYDGNVYFFNSNASTTNETNLTAATMYYYGSGAFLFWGGQQNGGGLLCEDSLQSLATTSDFLLIGTNSGIKHRPLSAGIPGLSVDFTTNAAATLNGAYQVLSLLAVYPELPEAKTPIYASQVYTGTGSSNSAQFDHVGLWAYYPSRGNWNRE